MLQKSATNRSFANVCGNTRTKHFVADAAATNGRNDVDNQHKHIKGYRDLSAEEIAMMNDVKAKGEQLGELLRVLREHPEVNQRWVSIGETHLQQGIMALVRSVAQPTTF